MVLPQKSEAEMRGAVAAWAEAIQQLVANGASAESIARHAAQLMASATALLKE